MNATLTLASAPELIFGLVAPIGVDLDLITDVLEQTVQEMGYEARRFRLTELMKEVPTAKPLSETPYIQTYRDRIAYANEVRRLLGDDALAVLAISAIRSFRAEERARRVDELARRKTPASEIEPLRDKPDADESDEEAPLPNQAYIIRQIKRPEEVALFRSVYGKQFILISAYAPIESRRRRIEDLEIRSRGGLVDDVTARNLAYELVAQDAKESLDIHGQNLSDAFPLGDVFIDATSRIPCDKMTRRFINLLFGSNEVTPTHDEYGRWMIHSGWEKCS